MGLEIERKFLVADSSWKGGATGTRYRQGYLSRAGGPTVRVRIAGEKGFLTVKGENRGLTRPEFEYEIPLADAVAMLDGLCEKRLIEKTRYRIPFGAHTWEVDEFHGENEGLVVAEVELRSADEMPDLPAWVGREVSGEPRYYNSSLARRPFSTWRSGP